MDARLVSLSDIRPYLGYWADKVVHARMGDPKVDRLVQLRRYVRCYGYHGVETLFTRLAAEGFPDDANFV